MGVIGKQFYSLAKSVVKCTSWGRKLCNIKSAALEFKSNPLKVENIDVFESITQGVKGREATIASNLLRNKGFNRSLQAYSKKTGLKFSELAMMNEEALFKHMAEHGGVGPNKFLQIISSDENMLKQMPESIQKMALKSRSENAATRTLSEVQEEISTMFNGKYNVEKQLGVGTIGEAYLIKDTSGKKYVAKLIKKGVDEDLLKNEEEIFIPILKQMIPDAQKARQKTELLKGLYIDWAKEVNFVQEAKYNEALAKGAKRFDVAKVVELSKDTKCVVQEMAEGVQSDKFIQMVKDYRKNPVEYAEKYKDVIEKYPALKTPEKVLNEFSDNFMGSFDEMLMFSKRKLKGSVMHGDPHQGNIFVSFTDKGKAKTTFIDTGNCVVRSIKNVKDDLSFFANYFVGNSKEVAKFFVERAKFLPKGKNLEQLQKEITQKFDEKLFKSGCNVTDFTKNQAVIDNILDETGIVLASEFSTSLKAELQGIQTAKELFNLSGKSNSKIISTMIPDVLKGVGKISLHSNPFTIIKPAGKQLLNNTETGFGTLFQMIG